MLDRLVLKENDGFAVTDREGNVTRYTYDNDHNLLEVHDPLGRRGARSEYDDTGRLVRLVNPDGNAIQFDRLEGSVEKVTDLIGNTTTRGYDEHGNVVTEIDAEGGVRRKTYDANNNMLTSTVVLEDGTELTDTYTVDSQGRVLTFTNPAGETTTAF